MRIEVKGTILAVITSGGVLGLTFGLAPFLRSSQAAAVVSKHPAARSPVVQVINVSGQAEQGRSLFARNCAHCHGDNARGDEGPTLYNLAMSDARIGKRIKEGIKGEMPKFGSKLNDMDVAALISYVRTLKD